MTRPALVRAVVRPGSSSRHLRPRAPSGLLVPATAFLSGALILAVEVLGPRLLQSFLGSGLYVWTAVLCVTLLALASGYWAGGALADRAGGPWLSLALVGGGATLLLLLPLRLPILHAVREWDLRLAALAATTAQLFVPLAFLGATGPLLVRRSTGRGIGRAVGRIYGISTVGSVCGALVTSFVLVERFRISSILLGAGLLAVALGGVWSRVERWRAAGPVAGAGFVTAAILWALDAPAAGARAAVVHVRDGLLGQIKVLDLDQEFDSGPARGRMLLVDGREQSVASADGASTWCAFVDDFLVARTLRPRARDALVIGLGGGQLARSLHDAGLAVEVAELDPRITEAARRFLGWGDAFGRVVHRDGRAHVEEAVGRWDLILINAYRSDALPAHLYTREMALAMARALRPGGVVACSFFAALEGRPGRATRSVARTLRSVFPELAARSRDLGGGGGFGELLLFASRAPLGEPGPGAPPAVDVPAEGGVVLTDDFNPLDVWLRDGCLGWHARLRGSVGAEALLCDRGR
jgi:hypothetical protein